MAEANEMSGNRSAAEIRQDIASKRESISEAVEQLGAKIQGTLDWRGYVSRHPYAAVGVAAGTGLLVSGIFRRKRRPAERIMDALADVVQDLASDARKSVSRIVVKTGAPLVVKTAVKVALTGMLSEAVSDFIHSRFIDGHGEDGSPTTDVRSSEPPIPSGLS